MLDEVGRRHGTDKWDASHSFLGESYLDVYERYLEPLRRRPLTVLELGVKAGGSLRMWKEYFPHGAIHGVDLNPRCQEETEERITVHTFSQDDEAGLTALAEAVGGFDLVLDDASHINALTAASFRILWPHVKAGGFYIIEDLGMSRVDYARLADPETFMEGELKINMDRGVSPHQDRSTLDAIFDDISSRWTTVPARPASCTSGRARPYSSGALPPSGWSSNPRRRLTFASPNSSPPTGTGRSCIESTTTWATAGATSKRPSEP